MKQDEGRLKSFLEKDPCCAAVHDALGMILKHSSQQVYTDIGKGFPPDVANTMVKHFQRGIANHYTSTDVCFPMVEHVAHQERLVASLLAMSGHYNSAVRVQKKSTVKTYGQDTVEDFSDRVILGLNLQHVADRFTEENQVSKMCSKYMESADMFIEAFRGAVERQSMNDFVHYFSQRQHILLGDKAATLENWKRMLHLTGNLLQACTNKRGQVVFLQDEERSVYQKGVRELPGPIASIEEDIAKQFEGLKVAATAKKGD
ncbi:MAG: hypothetical protein SGARI_002902 [Bacillariaceae sp.]